MALERTALRLAVIPALNADPIIAAMCAGRIYDSRIDQLSSKEPVPLIVVTTDDESGPAWSVNNGGPPFNLKCDLILEISVRVTVPTDGNDSESLGVLETDRELESALDLLEQRAVDAIAIGDTTQSALVRNTVLRRVSEMKSSRFVSDETGVKLAVRVVTLTAELMNIQPLDPSNSATGSFAVLPDPLRSVCAGLDPTSSGYAVCQSIATRFSPPTDLTLTGIDIQIGAAAQFDPLNPPSPTDPNAADLIFEKVDFP
ncbi:hypothetical protein LGH83_04580 [Lichenihabitans sp. PAMC28606]|uniref:hypothetical protein n=1 Tax=Lichenihabitans sp. PAMC28606 TaxID=2880932 RepID=UPI001D0ADBA9|nr:hypothetical protein [Lichenihabitans sp. PAMC28606]UDL95503.1 hypothetical protein LGH83_04580 [Lichenihabitans sp. PAMC28606]